jgi:hypothetical protein
LLCESQCTEDKREHKQYWKKKLPDQRPDKELVSRRYKESSKSTVEKKLKQKWQIKTQLNSVGKLGHILSWMRNFSFCDIGIVL